MYFGTGFPPLLAGPKYNSAHSNRGLLIENYFALFAAYNTHFRDSGGGCIVNITADSFRGMPMMAHTSAARAAVDNLTKLASCQG